MFIVEPHNSGIEWVYRNSFASPSPPIYYFVGKAEIQRFITCPKSRLR